MGNLLGLTTVTNKSDLLFEEWSKFSHTGDALAIAKDVIAFVVTKNGYRATKFVS